MLTLDSPPDVATLAREVRARRLWYHDIELLPGVRTRFPEDYDVNPTLRGVDAGSAAVLDWMADHVPADLSGRSVLDLGCADGLFTFAAARAGASRVVAIERNRYVFDRADWLRRTLALDNVELRFGSIESQCPSEKFDLVLCIGLIYHLVDPLGELHRIRRRCEDRLILASAVDLPDGDGSPISRLDRYAGGGHGLWAFNVPMLRQLLTTAGFDIDHETVQNLDGGRRFLAVATPSGAGDHHIFESSLDQEFPVNIERRRQGVRDLWQRLARDGDGPVALFGAGTHTPWLLRQVADIPGVEVAFVMDDRMPVSETVAGLPVRRPTTVAVERLSAVVLSSWHQTDALARRARDVFGNRVKVVSPGA